MEQSNPVKQPLAVEMIDITKRFGSQLANANICFDVRQGEIHCLVGENGAGKTTLMNILYGLIPADSGEIRIFGKSVAIHNPLDAMHLGIGMVHQHFKLVESYSVWENVILGHEPKSSIFIDQKKAIQLTSELSSQYGLAVDPKAVIRDLPVGVRQRVEILKTLYRGSQIIILDEPTAVLTPQESADLFKTIDHLVKGGKTVIFITHKLKEVMAVANRVTVLRHGERVGILNHEQVNEQSLTRMMVGREVMFDLDRAPSNPKEVALQVNHLSVRSDRGIMAVKDVGLTCHKGEIVTIAGVEGNGQSELIEAITGLRKTEKGQVLINNNDCTNLSPARIRDAGLSHVPEDRISTGLSIKETLEENLIAGRHWRAPYCNGLILNLKAMQDFSEKAIADFDIRASGPAELVQNLSGGNMQKVVLARELLFDTDLLVAVSPTRGVDIAAIESIHKTLIDARDHDRAILMVSTDLDEVMQISDRILVMFNGEIVGEFSPKATSREELGAYMIGARHSALSVSKVETEVPIHD